MVDTFKNFGWQGVHLRVPAGWELDAYNGDFKSGFLSLDDGREVCLRARWVESRRPQLESNLKKYRRALEKASKNTVQFAMGIPPFLAGEGVQQAVSFRWSADRAGCGLAYYYPASRRTVLLEILGTRDEDESVADAIMKSALQFRADGNHLWAVYGFEFLVPAGFRIEVPDLMPGRLRFLFRQSRRAWLRIERWAMAAEMLRKVPLEWWPTELLKLIKIAPRDLEQSEADINGHGGYAFDKASGGILNRVQTSGMVWVCPADDKLFAVMAGGKNAREVSAKVSASIQCAV